MNMDQFTRASAGVESIRDGGGSNPPGPFDRDRRGPRPRPTSDGHAPTDGGPPDRSRLRVLVVDDNEHAAQALAMIIDLWGHESRLAFHGDEAFASAEEFRPDVVLLDIGLPGMDGFTVARSLRADPRFRDAILLATTGYHHDEVRTRAAEAGFDRHMIKPLELDRLEAFLAKLAGSVPDDRRAVAF